MKPFSSWSNDGEKKFLDLIDPKISFDFLGGCFFRFLGGRTGGKVLMRLVLEYLHWKFMPNSSALDKVDKSLRKIVTILPSDPNQRCCAR